MSVFGILNTLLKYLTKFDGVIGWLLLPVIGILTIIYTVLNYAHSLLYLLLQKIDGLVANVDLSVGSHNLNSVSTDFWIMVNTFVPIDLVFELGVVLLSLRGIMASVRIIKSFIPTIA